MRTRSARYEVLLSDHGDWTVGPYQADTLTAARQIAEEYGTTKSVALVFARRQGVRGAHVATYRRSPDGDGTRWYRATGQHA